MDDRERAMRRAAELGIEFVQGLPERHVGAETDDAGLVARLGGPLPDDGEDPEVVVEQMARAFDPGLVASAGPRYFGFVVGGQLPAAAGAADSRPQTTTPNHGIREGRRAAVVWCNRSPTSRAPSRYR